MAAQNIQVGYLIGDDQISFVEQVQVELVDGLSFVCGEARRRAARLIKPYGEEP